MIRMVVGSLVDAAEQALAADSPVSGPYSQLSRRAAEAQALDRREDVQHAIAHADRLERAIRTYETCIRSIVRVLRELYCLRR
jgi:hypothetical protein